MENAASDTLLNFLKLIGHDIRWQILLALAESDLRVHEITQRLAQPQNLVSYHLQKLRQAKLVEESHSQADARSIYYHLNYALVQNKLQRIGEALVPTAGILSKINQPQHSPIRVLFVCTHNSARSQMAEGMLRAWGGTQVQAFSAGNEPKLIHPLAIQVMKEKNIDIHQQHAKGFELFSQQSFDYVITVCDRARENCPTFPGLPVQIHWSIPDPSLANGSEEERLNMFRSVADTLAERLRFLLDQIGVEKE
jgi:protein-tyrosine-phosphatase/DNA-binding transcriptional ArsR family regulator